MMPKKRNTQRETPRIPWPPKDVRVKKDGMKPTTVTGLTKRLVNAMIVGKFTTNNGKINTSWITWTKQILWKQWQMRSIKN